MNWKQKKIFTDDGLEVDAITPLIISVSRSTDIPAFYAKWFFNRLEKGYIAWINPFNQKTQYVSLDEIRFIIFWTKDPSPIIPFLDILENKGIGYYFQITLNDYEAEYLEPNVPPIEQRIQTFISLSQKIGKYKTIWRFDPLILSNSTTIEHLLKKIESIGEKINEYTEKLVFSFADINIYRKVIINLGKINATYREFSEIEINTFSSQLQTLNAKWKLELATCAEESNLKEFGILKNRCIDDELIYRISQKDKLFMDWLGFKNDSGSLFGSEYISNPKLKDKGQRKACGCMYSKDIGMYNTCNHLCAYCYANNSSVLVKKNFAIHNDNLEKII